MCIFLACFLEGEVDKVIFMFHLFSKLNFNIPSVLNALGKLNGINFSSLLKNCASIYQITMQNKGV